MVVLSSRKGLFAELAGRSCFAAEIWTWPIARGVILQRGTAGRCMHTNAHTRTYAHPNTFSHTCKHAHKHAGTHTCTRFPNTSTHAHAHTHTPLGLGGQLEKWFGFPVFQKNLNSYRSSSSEPDNIKANGSQPPPPPHTPLKTPSLLRRARFPWLGWAGLGWAQF